MSKFERKATKKQAKLRLAIIAPSGAGKTWTALSILTNMCNKVALIDSERGSASKYADDFEFYPDELENFSPDDYIASMHEAAAAGCDGLIIDGLSAAWSGKGGALEMVNQAQKRSQAGNSFMAWRDVTPKHNALVDAILSYPGHVVATMRSKTEYVIETNDKGKQVPRKIGTCAIQRDGLEYEFDVVADMTIPDHDFIVSKTRCKLLDGAVINKPGKDVADILKRWLTDGAPVAPSVSDVLLRRFGEVATEDEYKTLGEEAKVAKSQMKPDEWQRVVAAAKIAQKRLAEATGSPTDASAA